MKIRAKSLKIRENLWKFGQNLWKRSQNRCRWLSALILQKWHPKSKCRLFCLFGGHDFIWFFSGKLGELWASLGEIWAKMVLEVLWFKKCAQHKKKWSRFFWSFFRGSLGKFWKNPSHPQKFACSYTNELRAIETYKKQKNRCQICLFLFINNVDLKNNSINCIKPFWILCMRE